MDTSRLSGRALGEGDVPFVLETWNDERVTALVRETMSEQQVRDRIERWRRHRAEFGYATELFHNTSTGQPHLSPTRSTSSERSTFERPSFRRTPPRAASR